MRMHRMRCIGASKCASGEALKGIRGRSVLEYVTGAENFRNEASGVFSRAPNTLCFEISRELALYTDFL